MTERINGSDHDSSSSLEMLGDGNNGDVFVDESSDGSDSGGFVKVATNSNSNIDNKNTGGFLSIDCGSMTVRALIGLGIAGLGGTLVADVFGMFYVDCFLRAYRLPLRVFGIGSAIFAVINTANDVAGAYLCDWYASRQDRRREDLVGLSGCLFAISLWMPFWRWGPSQSPSPRQNFWDGLHFVGSLSVYDTLFSFNCILQGSIVSDNHAMTDSQRIAFFAAKDTLGILAPLLVTKIGLWLFDVANLEPFRIFLGVLVVVSCVLVCWGQALIVPVIPGRGMLASLLGCGGRSRGYARVAGSTTGTATSAASAIEKEENNTGNGSLSVDKTVRHKFSDDGDDDSKAHAESIGANADNDHNTNNKNNAFGFWRVVSDFAAHPNFRYWIGMEMLMEGQNTFMGNFQKTFVDQLLRSANTEDGGWSKEACDWLLALLDPATQIIGLLLFLPIRRYGYARLYTMVFATNILMATTLLLFNGLDNNTSDATWPVAAFLFVCIVLSNAMAGAGFGLAMCDMVLEMKHHHAVIEQRPDPPSLAGLFMGVNALFCKPAESVLPILAAGFLGDGYDNVGDSQDGDTAAAASSMTAESRRVLYRLLVLPPLVCSALQLVLWSRYSLVPEKTDRLRAELQQHDEQEQEDDSDGPQPQQQQQPQEQLHGAGIELHSLA